MEFWKFLFIEVSALVDSFYRELDKSKKKNYNTLFFTVFFLFVIRFLYFGFEYYPQLDDYIQHHNYAPQGDFLYLVERLGLLAARPLAGILDITLWSWLWPCAIIGVILLAVLYTIASVEFYKIFEKLLGISEFFLIIFALLPLGTEGTYWMSASTRIIPGMFFAALSASAFVRFLEEKRLKFSIVMVLCQLITFGFYEQTAVLSCALNIVIACFYFKHNNRRWRMCLSCFLCAGCYFLITSLAKDSPLYVGRTSIILPTSAYYFDNFLPNLLSQIKSAFLGGGYYTLVYGFIRGIMRVFKDGAWLYVVSVITLCIVFGYIVATNEKGKRPIRILTSFVVGIVLTLAPLAPFFIIENPWFSFRGTVPSFLGIAIICDTIIRLVTRNNRTVVSVISTAFAFVFCICAVSEISDYRSTYLADTKVVSAIATVTPEIKKEIPDKGKVAVFNVDPRYVTELNSYYHEHIHGVTESDWALTGAIQCYNNNPFEGITYVPFSLKEPYLYKKWNYATKNIASMDAVYVYDYKVNTIERLTVEALDSSYNLYYSDGEKYGTVVEMDDYALFIEE